MRLYKNIFLLISVSLFSIPANAQHSLQIGFGMHFDEFSANAYIIDSLLVRGDKTGDDPRPSFVVYYNYLLKNKLNAEIGLKIYNTYYSYFVGQKYPPFGYVNKAGGVKLSTINIPINLEYQIHKFFYVKGGFSTSFGKLNKQDDLYFTDTPAVNEIYNKLKHTFKSGFINYGVGAGFIFSRFDISYYFASSLSAVSNPLEVNRNQYTLFNKVSTHHIELTYSLFFNKGKE